LVWQKKEILEIMKKKMPAENLKCGKKKATASRKTKTVKIDDFDEDLMANIT
jgi:hypothetical protein